MKTVKIYEKGYVRIGLLATSATPLERLISIEASANVQKKSGLGRGAAAVATAGYSLASSNKRGDVYLTVVTDRKTYVLHEDPPTAGNLRVSKKLEAAGNAAIRTGSVNDALSRRPPEEAGQESSTHSQDGSGRAFVEAAKASGTSDGNFHVSDRLRELNSLHEEGLVSDEEFTELRAKLLDSL